MTEAEKSPPEARNREGQRKPNDGQSVADSPPSRKSELSAASERLGERGAR